MSEIIKEIVLQKVDKLESQKNTLEIARLTKEKSKLTKRINTLKSQDAEKQELIDQLIAWEQSQP